MKLYLTLACGRYDRTLALLDGSVRPEGIELNFIPMLPHELFRRQARHAEFDAAEFSLATYAILLARGDRRLVAIPVFPSRKFRHGDIYVHAGAGIRTPADLAGKRVGAAEYQQSAAVWVRGMLQDDYGVRPEDVEWFFGGYNQPEAFRHRIPIELPPGVRSVTIPPERTLSELLERGEIDALMGPNPPEAFLRGSPAVRRLYEDYLAAERDYFRRTGIFPIMHTVVVKREIYERHPWVAVSLFKAFAEAKVLGTSLLARTNILFCSLPWLNRHLEHDLGVLGKNPFAYGLERNRHTLEVFLRYLREQGLLARPLVVEELFAPETHELTDPMD